MSGPATPAPFAGAELDSARKRSNRLLVSGAALGSISHIAAVTVAVVAANQMLEGAALAGAANMTIVIGSAVGTSLLSALMLRRGRRVGLVTGYVVAVIGAIVAAFGVLTGNFLLLLAGMLILGLGNSSNQLSRYAAADMAPAERRAKAIGLVVWAATVGAIIGPNVVPFAASLSESAGLPALVGPFLIPVVFAGAAAVLLFWKLRPDPYALADEHARVSPETAGSGRPLREVMAVPRVAVAITALITGQVVMVVVMTMTPLHMINHGHGLAAVGLVLSAHTAGMFALSPVSGWLSQRLGYIGAILLGVGVLGVACAGAAIAPQDGGAVLFGALFLLGFGWNICFVAGSALLTTGVRAEERTQIEGFSDSMIWGSSAVASLASGLILAAAGFSALGVIAASMLLLPVFAVLRTRGHLAEPSTVSP